LFLNFSLLGEISCPITLMTEAATTSETSVDFYQITRPNITEDSHFHSQYWLVALLLET
jgi:hypothetical protein